MRIGLFSDSHYSSAAVTCGNRYNSKGLERISKALQYFSAEKCDVIICLGDLIDKEAEHDKEIKHLKQISKLFSKTKIQIYALMGNHDAFAFGVEEFYSILGERFRPKNVFQENANLVFLDACYFKNGKHYQPGDSDWTDTFLPSTETLEKTLTKARGDVCIFIHQNIDPAIMDNHRLSNDKEIRDILEKSKKVKTVFQGHYHKGNASELNGISYLTLRALCEYEDAYTVIDIP